jgi:hypothetical protein
MGRIGKARLNPGVLGYVPHHIGTTFVGDYHEEEALTPTLTPPPTTVAAPAVDERCDRCTAPGKLRIMIAGGGDLVFCGHHANKYAADLAKIAVQFGADPEFDWRGRELTAN